MGCTFILGSLIGSAALAPAEPLPAANAPAVCDDCHVSETQGVVTADLVEDKPAFCMSCHIEIWGATSHPIGVVPSEPLPSEFPLDADGRLSCRTCHQLHGEVHGELRADATGSSFCSKCHEQAFFDQMPDGGSSLLPFGHIPTRVAGGLAEVDSPSAGCLACHVDGDSTMSSQNWAHANPATTASSHPVGVDYDVSARFGGYRDAFLLPSEVLLPDGKVSCVSCHAVYVANHGALVLPMGESRLCFSCHDL